MRNIKSFDDLDLFVTEFMSKWGVTLLRYSLGIIYIWFGALKPLGLSPAQELVENTVYWFENPKTFVPIFITIRLTFTLKHFFSKYYISGIIPRGKKRKKTERKERRESLQERFDRIRGRC